MNREVKARIKVSDSVNLEIEIICDFKTNTAIIHVEQHPDSIFEASKHIATASFGVRYSYIDGVKTKIFEGTTSYTDMGEKTFFWEYPKDSGIGRVFEILMDKSEHSVVLTDEDVSEVMKTVFYEYHKRLLGDLSPKKRYVSDHVIPGTHLEVTYMTLLDPYIGINLFNGDDHIGSSTLRIYGSVCSGCTGYLNTDGKVDHYTCRSDSSLGTIVVVLLNSKGMYELSPTDVELLVTHCFEDKCKELSESTETAEDCKKPPRSFGVILNWGECQNKELSPTDVILVYTPHTRDVYYTKVKSSDLPIVYLEITRFDDENGSTHKLIDIKRSKCLDHIPNLYMRDLFHRVDKLLQSLEFKDGKFNTSIINENKEDVGESQEEASEDWDVSNLHSPRFCRSGNLLTAMKLLLNKDRNKFFIATDIDNSYDSHIEKMHLTGLKSLIDLYPGDENIRSEQLRKDLEGDNLFMGPSIWDIFCKWTGQPNLLLGKDPSLDPDEDESQPKCDYCTFKLIKGRSMDTCKDKDHVCACKENTNLGSMRSATINIKDGTYYDLTFTVRGITDFTGISNPPEDPKSMLMDIGVPPHWYQVHVSSANGWARHLAYVPVFEDAVAFVMRQNYLELESDANTEQN